MTKVDALYASLNIQDQFPELDGIAFDFVRVLLLARDLKINIRKRAVGSFFEWDKLDQAVGGGQKPLGNKLDVTSNIPVNWFSGTKLHQQTRKAIAKRQPALMAAIRKFNTYCEHLAELHDASCSIPIPNPLPTKLAELRADQSLMEDVWITPSLGAVPLWISDRDIRSGIRGMLKSDRCLEERHRLGLEADNLCCWYGNELAAIELSLLCPGNEIFLLFLQQRRDHILSLRGRWTNTLVSAARFESHTKEAVSIATSLVSGTCPISAVWVEPIIVEASDIIPEEATDPMDSDMDPPDDEVSAPLLDYLEEENLDPNEEDPDDTQHLGNPRVTLVWRVPLVRSLWFEVFTLIANMDQNLTIDPRTIYTQRASSVNNALARRILPPRNGFLKVIFDIDAIKLLRSPTAWLDDICINGCISLLFATIPPDNWNDFAVFSTHDLPRIRYNATDEVLWRCTRHTSFWTKDIWILPIHRPGHWVLCIARLAHGELLLFDSLGKQHPWRMDVKDIMKLVSRLFDLARRQHPDTQLATPTLDWVARPLVMEPLQTNGFDCASMSQPSELFYDYSQTQLGGGRRDPSPVIETPTKLWTRLKPTARDGGLVSSAQSRRAKMVAGVEAIPVESPPSEGAHDVYEVHQRSLPPIPLDHQNSAQHPPIQLRPPSVPPAPYRLSAPRQQSAPP
ncbi:hypothetical protein JVU11DRAFT_10781 [Chiua virens]|nr:hypothetical protein JVU11DRAFT_10781 [Chiua virens]